LSDKPPFPLPPLTPFIREVRGYVLFISHGGAGRDYKWNPMGFVFTKMPPKATNGPQILFCEPLGYVIGP